ARRSSSRSMLGRILRRRSCRLPLFSIAERCFLFAALRSQVHIGVLLLQKFRVLGSSTADPAAARGKAQIGAERRSPAIVVQGLSITFREAKSTGRSSVMCGRSRLPNGTCERDASR